MSDRIEAIHAWLASTLGRSDYSFAPASSDASFRRYFRIQFDQESLIVMDAPVEHENSEKFIRIAQMLARFGLNVPIIKAQDLAQGFLLLSDLGERVYLGELNDDTVERLYGDALAALVVLQKQGADFDLPAYDEALLLRELEIFREWYLGKHIQYDITPEFNDALDQAFGFLTEQALAQPTVIVHRDYHSRNLLVTAEHNPGLLDFQDAVIGPVTYDLVSLLRDCYIKWPQDQVHIWLKSYYHIAQEVGIIPETVTEADVFRWFDLMGIQRHLKAAGIFARLNHRDNKPGYLNDIPRTLGYVRDASAAYDELKVINDLLNSLNL